MNKVGQLIRDANPIQGDPSVLADDELDALLLLARARSGTMDIQELTRPVEPEKKRERSGWLIATVSFAVVIVFAVAAVLLSRPSNEIPPASSATDTEGAVEPVGEVVAVEDPKDGSGGTEVDSNVALTDSQQAFVEEFISAFNAGANAPYPGDFERFLGYFDPDAVIRTTVSAFNLRGPLAAVDVARYRSILAFHGAMNMKIEIAACHEDFGAIVCRAGITSDRYTGVDGPVESSVRIVASDGLVKSFSLPENPTVTNVGLGSFFDWVRENHPGSIFLMRADNGSGVGTPKVTEESINLWLELLPLY